MSREREGRLVSEEAFANRKPCELGGCPDCEFFKTKLDKCKEEDSNDSAGVPDTAEIPLNVARMVAFEAPERRWAFCGREEDSDMEEEPELLDGGDCNYDLTRRLHEPPRTTLPDWRETASDVANSRDSVCVEREQNLTPAIATVGGKASRCQHRVAPVCWKRKL